MIIVATILFGAGLFVIVVGCIEFTETYKDRGRGFPRGDPRVSYRTAYQWFALAGASLLAAWLL